MDNKKNIQGGVMLRGIILFLVLAQTDLAFSGNQKILADLNFLKAMGIQSQIIDEDLNLAIAEVTDYQISALPHFAHKFKKCGGFELLDDNNLSLPFFREIAQLNRLNLQYEMISFRMLQVPVNSEIQNAVNQVSVNNLKSTVQWLSAFPSRFHKNDDGKKAVQEFYKKIQTGIQESEKSYAKVDLISHVKTPQPSIRVHVEGRSRPQEVVVIGAHFDSINSWNSGGKAPGADDNASGSANVLETLRVLLTQDQPERSIEFFWYAGEEAGLLGSAEIAAQYKQENKQVIGVLQLDMTAFAGEGETVIGEMTDFTSTWLRDYLRELNTNYVGATWVQDKCGYGCSDHASWYRNGFPTVIPFEARMNTMNQDLHTPSDIVSPSYSFTHSAIFAKLAVAYVLDLGKSTLKQPY
jgi:leucyl aminopeptidase